MAVTAFDGSFSFKQDSLARLGHRETQKMNPEQYSAFQNSPFMQGVRKCEDLCWKFTCSRDDERAKRDPSFNPNDEDFSAPKAHGYDRAINYYKVLGIDEYASLDEVKKAYKKLSLVYHPDKTSGLSAEQKEEYSGVFIELKNAYLTLGDQATRRQFDRDRDRDKASFEINGWKPKTRAQFDATEMLKKLQEMQKPPGQVVNVAVSAKLEKMFYGGHKKIKRQRRVKDFGGFTTETRVYRVDIPRGAIEPHECTFRRQGDHHEHTSPDTVNFQITAKPHDTVERQGGDLACKAVVYLGADALRRPYVSAQAPSVRGRHVLLWGRNPFVYCPGVTGGNLRVRIRGEGLSETGALKLACRLGTAPPGMAGMAGADAARSAARAGQAARTAQPGQAHEVGHGDTAVITVRHMQTEAKLWLRVPRSATMADIRAKVSAVLALPRGSTVRLLQQVAGGFTPYPDRQPLNGLTSLNCAGTAWHGVAFTQDKLQLLLEKMVAATETEAFQADLAEARSALRESPAVGVNLKGGLFGRLAELLPDFGCEISVPLLHERLAQARAESGQPQVAALLEKISALERLGDEPSAKVPEASAGTSRGSGGGSRRSPKRFLVRLGLGPPEGFAAPGSETEGEISGGGARGAGVGGRSDAGIANAPAMLRRIAQRRLKEQTCEVELSQVGEPITLFTRPTCSVTFYSNARQALPDRSGLVPPRPMFGISISAPSCAKKAAANDWALLKANIIPVLQATGFLLLRPARMVLPRPLANAAQFECSDEDEALTESELLALRAGGIDFERCCVERDGESAEDFRQRCEQARQAKMVSLRRQVAFERRTAASGDVRVPWKQVGDAAFRRGDYFTGVNCYSKCLEVMDASSSSKSDTGQEEIPAAEVPAADLGREVAVVLSNRSACFAKVKNYEESLSDAEAALTLRPNWGRAWGRVGFAAASLGRAEDALHAYVQATAAEPSAANVSALAEAVARKGVQADAAHEKKEEGNIAMRAGEFGLAAAHFTHGIALLPPDPKDADPSNAGDEFAFLRAVLFSNRSAAFARLRDWPQALADARRAVAAKDDFAKAHCRLGAALLGHGCDEQAYAEFARALSLEANDPVALKGRQACISLLPFWASQAARQRHHRRFAADLARPAGSTRVFAISDVHFDHKCNEEWAHTIDDFKFQEDVLVVAGNMCDTANALRRALTTLKAKFRRVFYVPGNHELWVHPSEASKYPDSFAKLMSVLQTCDDLGVDTFPAAVCKDVFVVPLLSWYNSEFDAQDPFPDPSGKVDQHCRWPIPETQVWKYMLKLNSTRLAHLYHGTVISFSHFLPSAKLPFAEYGSAAKTTGCEQLDEQVRALRGQRRMHIYGHTHRRHVEALGDVTYVNNYHGEEGGKADRAEILLVYDGRSLTSRPESIRELQRP